MRDLIKQTLQQLQDWFGEGVFTDEQQFKSGIADALGTINIASSEREIISDLLVFAFFKMNAYVRLQAALNKGELFVVGALISELNQMRFFGKAEDEARVVIESIAELIGYTLPTSATQSQLVPKLLQPVAPKPKQTTKSQPIPSPELTVVQKGISKGDIIRFGKYDWLVLKVNPDNTALIITKDIIEQRAYHHKDRRYGLEQERQEKERRKQQWIERGRCRYCGGRFKRSSSLFPKKCKSCGSSSRGDFNKDDEERRNPYGYEKINGIIP